MEQKVIQKENNRCIFLLKDERSSFYIIIPRIQKLSISLSIFDTIDDNQIKEFPIIQDKAIIVPIIDNNILMGVKNNNAEYYNYLEKLFSIIVNTSYKLLKFNNIEVENKIILDNNEEYKNFNNWYLVKYKERVGLLDLGLHKSSIVSKPLFEGVEETKAPANENLNVTLTNFTPEQDLNQETIMTPQEPETSSSPGFISYVLLGVVVAVISLVLLYMLV